MAYLFRVVLRMLAVCCLISPLISNAAIPKAKIYTVPNPVSNGPLLRANSAEAVCAAFSGAYKWP
ncbi:MAG: hypothetical protein LBJ40_16940, partial [Delftia acidovorans]|nr:hypothetical protein [Delftia acidovorans]